VAKLPAHRPISASIDALSQEESAKLLKSESMRSSNLQRGGIRKRIRILSSHQAATIIRNTNATANSSTRDSMNMETHIISRRLRDGTTVFSGGLAPIGVFSGRCAAMPETSGHALEWSRAALP